MPVGLINRVTMLTGISYKKTLGVSLGQKKFCYNEVTNSESTLRRGYIVSLKLNYVFVFSGE